MQLECYPKNRQRGLCLFAKGNYCVPVDSNNGTGIHSTMFHQPSEAIKAVRGAIFKKCQLVFNKIPKHVSFQVIYVTDTRLSQIVRLLISVAEREQDLYLMTLPFISHLPCVHSPSCFIISLSCEGCYRHYA